MLQVLTAAPPAPAAPVPVPAPAGAMHSVAMREHAPVRGICRAEGCDSDSIKSSLTTQLTVDRALAIDAAG